MRFRCTNCANGTAESRFGELVKCPACETFFLCESRNSLGVRRVWWFLLGCAGVVWMVWDINAHGTGGPGRSVVWVLLGISILLIIFSLLWPR